MVRGETYLLEDVSQNRRPGVRRLRTVPFAYFVTPQMRFPSSREKPGPNRRCRSVGGFENSLRVWSGPIESLPFAIDGVSPIASGSVCFCQALL
jgi:hypothetical protein